MEPIIISSKLVVDNDCKVTVSNEAQSKLIAIFSSNELEATDVCLAIKTLKEGVSAKLESVAQLLAAQFLLEQVDKFTDAAKLELWPMVAAAKEAAAEAERTAYDNGLVCLLTGDYETVRKSIVAYLTRDTPQESESMTKFLQAYTGLLVWYVLLSAPAANNKLVTKFVLLLSSIMPADIDKEAFKAVGRLLLGA